MTDQARLTAMMNKNIKMSPLLFAFSWDVWFVWTITTMFLSQVKGFSYSQVIMLDSILMGIGAVFCFLGGKMFKKLSPLNAIRLGIFCYGIFLLIYIFATEYYTFIIAQLFLALGYALCGIKTNAFINDSLTIVKRNKEFDKISGAGNSLLYIIESIGAILITYIYNWNAYMAFWVAVGIVVISEVYTLFAANTQKYMSRNVLVDANVKQISNRRKPKFFTPIIISILIFSFFMRASVCISVSSYKIFLQQAQDGNLIKPWMFGYLFALARLSMAFSSRIQFKLSLRYGIKTISAMVLLIIFSFLTIGIVNRFIPESYITLIISIAIFCVLISVRPPLQIITAKYINKFVGAEKVDQVFAGKMVAEYSGFTIGSLIFSRLLTVFNDNLGQSTLVFIFILVVPLVVSTLIYLRNLFLVYNKTQTIIKQEYTED